MKNERGNDGCKQDLRMFGPECSQILFGKDAIGEKTTRDKSSMDMEDMETQVAETLSVEEKSVTMSGEGKQTERRKAQPNDGTYQRNQDIQENFRKTTRCVCRHDLYNEKSTMYLTYPESKKRGGGGNFVWKIQI